MEEERAAVQDPVAAVKAVAAAGAQVRAVAAGKVEEWVKAVPAVEAARDVG
jgi:hypothetical protein